jgi:hypothetical protein
MEKAFNYVLLILHLEKILKKLTGANPATFKLQLKRRRCNRLEHFSK